MKSLQGHIPASEYTKVLEAAKLRFKNHLNFRTPEALVVYEQGMLAEDELRHYCELEYGTEFQRITPGFVVRDIVDAFRDSPFIPFSVDTTQEQISLACIPEQKGMRVPTYKGYSTGIHEVTIYDYVSLYTSTYGRVPFLYELHAKDYFDFIVEEATALGASDITVSCDDKQVLVYYEVRKKKVHSRRVVPLSSLDSLIEYIANKSRGYVPAASREPVYLSLDLNLHYRGRAIINTTYYGKSATIRVIPNDMFQETLESLNIDLPTQKFIREVMLSPEPGLRLLIGAPSSGKNTTTLAALMELVNTDKYKIVSVENPVESVVAGIEQIDTTSEDEVLTNIASLIRQNPSLIYITEITAATAVATLNISNVAKAVFSSVHASSASLVISRLIDLTGLPSDRILLSMHSCVYQELVRDEEQDKLFPKTTCLYFSDELKAQLIGKTPGEIYLALKKEEAKWIS